MTERSPSFGLRLCFFSPLRRHLLSSRGSRAQQPLVPRVVLVSSPSDVTQDELGSEGWCDFECDCSDCDCACFTNDD
jgi:hypothetical protein